MDVWVTIGFTYKANEQKYYLIKEYCGYGICLACTCQLEPEINEFCYQCKASRPVNWTTGNKSLDLFIMESWSNVEDNYDTYLQWIEYSLLMNVREITTLRHGCTHIANRLEPATNKLTRVTLKKIVDRQDAQFFDFHQVNYLCVK